MKNGNYELIGFIAGILIWIFSAFISYELVSPHDFVETLVFLIVFLIIGKVLDVFFLYIISNYFSDSTDKSQYASMTKSNQIKWPTISLKTFRIIGILIIIIIVAVAIAFQVDRENTEKINAESATTKTIEIRMPTNDDIKLLKKHLQKKGYKKVDYSNAQFVSDVKQFLLNKGYSIDDVNYLITYSQENMNKK